MFTSSGGLILASSILVGPFTERYYRECRLALRIGYCAVSLILFRVLGGLAAKQVGAALQ